MLTLVILLSAVPTLLQAWAMPDWNGYGAGDYELYMTASARWLETGVFYEPHQLAGPYAIGLGDILYPPVSLWLFVPFTFLPGFLWWAIPLGVTAWVLWSLRPSPVAWPLMALCVTWEPGYIHVVAGNPVMWSLMAVALATRYPVAAPFALLKASLFPFALFRIDRRAWWVGLAVWCALSLPFLPMWFDWLRVVTNGRAPGGLLYSLQEAPLLALPIIAWLYRPGGRYGQLARYASISRQPANDPIPTW